jgi:hypothetical protein
MIGRYVARLLLDVRAKGERAIRERRTVVRPKGNVDREAPGLLYRATSCIDVLLAAGRGVESLLRHDGELGEPRTALGVVSGRHSRMLRAVESPPRTGLGLRRVPVRHRVWALGQQGRAARAVTTPVATPTQSPSEVH